MSMSGDALRIEHLGDPAVSRALEKLAAGARLRLIIDGRPILFRKDEGDGLRDEGAGPGAGGIGAGAETDNDMTYLGQLFSEWNSPEDEEAFRDL